MTFFKNGFLSREKLLEALAVRWADKPRGPGHPVSQLERLQASARAISDTELNNDPPPPDWPGEGRLLFDGLSTNYRTALNDIADGKFVGSQKHGEQRWRADRKGAHPELLEFERLLLRQLHRCNVPAFGHCVWRNGIDQDRLFIKGVSKARAGQSAHNFGCAVDVIHGVKGWELPRRSWKIIGHLGKELAARNGIAIEWGGDWKFWDPAHWQLKGWQGYPKTPAANMRPDGTEIIPGYVPRYY